MLCKFESKSARVKGISFHPKRSWVLVSLHSGLIQLWDYNICTLLDKFEEHTGPVRGICFHNQQPLFVSGGDDYKIKVWNYKQRKCIFTLLGHMDYIRCTIFHYKYPWIVSASDDQTARIWNWQNRTCICVLTGHTHYVMSALFHPSQDILMSASLDQTIRLWDITGLQKKSIASEHSILEDRLENSSAIDLFGQGDAFVKHILEGHDRGVNWACFHPTLPLIASGGDDRLIKLWRLNESKVWEVDTFRGHYNNVSCVIFHPRKDVLLSNSEDKSIKVWDITKRICLHTFRRENERFWVLAVHPSLNLFAAGHDAGMTIFKLQKERPAYTVYKSFLYYIKNKFLHKLNILTSTDTAILQVCCNEKSTVHFMSFNPEINALLMSIKTSNLEFSTYNLYNISKETELKDQIKKPSSKCSAGVTAVWINKNNFVVLDCSQQLILKNLKNEFLSRIKSPPCDEIFYAGTEMLLLRDSVCVSLFNVQMTQVLTQIKIPKCKFVHWSSNMLHVALLSKNIIVICNHKLEKLCSIYEKSSIKSGAWDDDDVFIYTTNSHIKYAIPNGDYGIIRTLDVPIYITHVKGNLIFCLDRECKPHTLCINPVEYKFKLALLDCKYNKILGMVNNSQLMGQSIVSYLQQKGHTEVALHFVKDQKSKFALALKCGNVEAALKAAQILNLSVYWNHLSEAAMKQGNLRLVRMCYQHTNNFNKLLFLYLITGNLKKVKELSKIMEIKKDVSMQYQTAVLLGDSMEKIKILKICRQESLAYLAAVTHGFTNEALTLYDYIRESGNEVPKIMLSAKFMRIPTPIQQVESNWPLLTGNTTFLKRVISMANKQLASANKSEKQIAIDAWGVNVELLENKNKELYQGSSEDSHNVENEPKMAGENNYVLLTKEIVQTEIGKKLPVDYAVAGTFSHLFDLLHKQLGVVHFKPFKPVILNLFIKSRLSFSGFPNLHPMYYHYYNQNRQTGELADSLVTINVKFNYLHKKLQACYQLTTHGKFKEAIDNFQHIILNIPFLDVNKKQSLEAQELLVTCKEYISALRVEIARRSLSKAPLGEQKRQCEMAAYLTCFNLQPVHNMLTLYTAANVFYKVKNYKSAAFFAERLLELKPNPHVEQRAQNILQASSLHLVDEVKIDYSQYSYFDLCAATFVPLYQGNPKEECSLCGGKFLPEYKGLECTICAVSEIGRKGSGLCITRN